MGTFAVFFITSNTMKRLHFLFLICAYFTQQSIFAAWNVPISHYTPSNYEAGTQNWQILTAANGWLYAANNNGLLEYDGSQWQTYGMPYSNVLRSIALYHNQAVFAGGTNDFGVYSPTDKGELEYRSLLEYIDWDESDFGEVWAICCLDKQVYFFMRHWIVSGEVQYTDSIALTNVRTQYIPHRIFCAQEVDGAIYVGTDNGLYILSGMRLNRINGSDICASYEIRGIQPLDSQSLLIGTDLGGLFIYDGTQVRPFRTEADSYLRTNQLYSLAVRHNTIAIGTVRGGMVVMQSDGTHCHYISRSEGLQNNTVLSLTFDHNHNIWVGLDQGIDYVQLSAGQQYLYDPQVDLGTGYDMLQVRSGSTVRSYYATNQGLYVSPSSSFHTDPQLRLIEGSMGQVWSIASISNTLFCCHNRGLFIVQHDRLIPLCTDVGFWRIESLSDGRILAGSYSGFYLLQRTDAGWQIEKIEGYDATAFRWQIDATGAIWALSSTGLVRLTWDNVHLTLYSEDIQPYNGTNDWFNISRLGDTILITNSAYCRIVDEHGTLYRDSAFFARMAGETYYALIQEDNHHNILFIHGNSLYIALPQNAFVLLGGETGFVGGFENIYETNEGYVIGLTQGFCLLQPHLLSDTSSITDNTTPSLYLRQVSLMNKDNQRIYGESLHTPSSHPSHTDFSLPYDRYALHFACCLNADPTTHTQYAYRLHPRDQVFTSFSSLPYFECSSLEDGKYTLEIICRTVSPQQAPVEITHTWTFRILPPWYKTWWARTLFVILTLLFLCLIGYILHILINQRQLRLLHEQELHILQLENEKAQTRLQSKSQEMTRILHEEAVKQEQLSAIAEEITATAKDLQAHNYKKADDRLQRLQQEIGSQRDDSIDWQRFEENFDEVNAGFCKALTIHFPWLSKQERKLCIYIHLGMLTKEIAPLLGLSVRGVEMMRYRMRTKMNLDPQANLREYLQTLHQ